MDKDTFTMIMEFYKMLNQLYNKDIIGYIQYTDIIDGLLAKMFQIYETGDPLDKCY